MRHVFETMGTVASLQTPAECADLVDSITEVFAERDQRFSLYRDDSELRSIADGRLALRDGSDEMIATYTRAITWRGRTDGAFTPHRPDGALDLNGIVKAEAIEAAGLVLDGAGCRDWTINVGGDILTSAPHGCFGISDPHDPTQLLATVTLVGSRRALATSGSAERGDHIWRGGTTTTPDIVQASVIADDIVTADVLATAIVAGGLDALDDLLSRWPVDALVVGRDGSLRATPGFASAAGVGR